MEQGQSWPLHEAGLGMAFTWSMVRTGRYLEQYQGCHLHGVWLGWPLRLAFTWSRVRAGLYIDRVRTCLYMEQG
jgi:hypothetical protein